MAEVKIQEGLWQEFVSTARKQRRKPEILAAKVLRDYLQRVDDEDLLARSEHAARRTKFRIEDTEEIIREYRRKKRRA